MQRLEAAAEEVAAGRFVPPLPVDSEDELGQLTRAFNEMQAQLERVDRARREFIANASHELRTPIFSLGGFVELLRDEELDVHARAEFLQAVAEQVERLQKLATDLLDLSRLDAGSLDLATESVDLAQLTDSVAKEFVPALDAHGSKLAVEIGDDRVEAVCDPDRVAQIMRILLDNALRHTPPGTDVEITARARGRPRADRRRRRRAGLEETTRRHAFDRFFTADGASGSGLGLAIAKELAERMDGGITLSSRARPDGLHPRSAGERGVRAALAGAVCALALVGAGCSLGEERRRARPPRSEAPEQVETTRVQVVEGIGTKDGFDAQRDLRPARAGRRDGHLAVRRRGRTAREASRAGSARASSSTATATSRPTRTS